MARKISARLRCLGWVPDSGFSVFCKKKGYAMNFTGTVPLETSRLLLRPFAPSDVQDCLRFWATDPSVYRYISQEPMTVDEIEEWLS